MNGKTWLHIGLLLWTLVFLAHMTLGYFAHTSVAFALFPTWAVPLAYVAWRVAAFAIAMFLVIVLPG